MNANYTLGALKNLRSSEEEIVVIGPPARMSGTMHLENTADEPLVLHEVPLKTGGIDAKTKKRVERHGSLKLMANLGARESKSQRVFCSLDPATPPGTYESEIVMGATKKKATLMVQSHLSVSLNPNHAVLVGIEPNKKHEVVFQLANHGNIPLEVPRLRHVTTLDMDLYCRNLALAVRESGDKGAEAFLDSLAKGIRRDMAGWIELSVAEAGAWIEPGKARLLHLTMTLPADIHHDREYRGTIRIFNTQLTFLIVTAASSRKSGNE